MHLTSDDRGHAALPNDSYRVRSGLQTVRYFAATFRHFRYQTAPSKYVYMLGGMVLLC
jgi:hypothetical protein